MTYKEILRREIELRQWVLDGGSVDCLQFNGSRDTCVCPTFSSYIECYRKVIKPKIRKIPLDKSDIILGTTVIRNKTAYDNGMSYVIISLNDNTVMFVSYEGIERITFSCLQERYEMLVAGKWVPCEKESEL